MAEMICALVKDDCGKPIYLVANFTTSPTENAEEALLLDDSRLGFAKLNQMVKPPLKRLPTSRRRGQAMAPKFGYLAFVDEDEDARYAFLVQDGHANAILNTKEWSIICRRLGFGELFS